MSLEEGEEQRRLEEVYTCPISFEIPFDPVTAEDGIVYERRAIQSWFETFKGHEVRSPVTNSLIQAHVPSDSTTEAHTFSRY